MRRTIELDVDEVCDIIAEHLDRINEVPLGWIVECESEVIKADRVYDQTDRIHVTFVAKQRVPR